MSPPLAHEEVAEGPGDPLLLMHGFLGSRRNLTTLARRLAAAGPARPVVLVDLPGHGDSPGVAAGASLEEAALPLVELLDARFPGRPAHLIGHSLGGRVAMAASLVAPARVARVVALDVSPGGRRELPGVDGVVEALLELPEDGPDREAFRAPLLARGMARPFVDWLLMNLRRGDGGRLGWRIDRQRLAERIDAWRGEDLWASAEGASARLQHVVRGGASDFVTDDEVARLEAAGCRVDTLEGAGHFVHVEALDPLVGALDQGQGK